MVPQIVLRYVVRGRATRETAVRHSLLATTEPHTINLKVLTKFITFMIIEIWISKLTIFNVTVDLTVWPSTYTLLLMKIGFQSTPSLEKWHPNRSGSPADHIHQSTSYLTCSQMTSPLVPHICVQPHKNRPNFLLY